MLDAMIVFLSVALAVCLVVLGYELARLFEDFERWYKG
jgi:hypothetical protein